MIRRGSGDVSARPIYTTVEPTGSCISHLCRPSLAVFERNSNETIPSTYVSCRALLSCCVLAGSRMPGRGFVRQLVGKLEQRPLPPPRADVRHVHQNQR